MADFTAKKSDFLSKATTFAEQLLRITRDAEELALYQTDNAFQAGGANAIVDADATGANAHLTAAMVNAVLTVAGQLAGAMTAPRRATLRQASRLPDV